MNKHQQKAKLLLDYLTEHPETRFWQGVTILFSYGKFIGMADNHKGSGYRDLFFED